MFSDGDQIDLPQDAAVIGIIGKQSPGRVGFEANGSVDLGAIAGNRAQRLGLG